MQLNTSTLNQLNEILTIGYVQKFNEICDFSLKKIKF